MIDGTVPFFRGLTADRFMPSTPQYRSLELLPVNPADFGELQEVAGYPAEGPEFGGVDRRCNDAVVLAVLRRWCAEARRRSQAGNGRTRITGGGSREGGVRCGGGGEGFANGWTAAHR